MVIKSQEKLRKMIKIRKSQLKMGVFEKSKEKIKKTSDFVSSYLPNSLYLKPSNGKKLIKNSLKSD